MKSAQFLTYTTQPNNAPTIILLHGFLGNASQWDWIIQELRSKFQILLIELPGHGMNNNEGAYSIVDLSHEVYRIINKLGLEQVHMVGHSMGGYVASAFTKAYPKQTASLTLINSCAGADTPSRKIQRDRSLRLLDSYPAAFVKMAIANLFTANETIIHNQAIGLLKSSASRMSLASIKNAIIAMRDRPDFLDGLQDLRSPVIYIFGKKDAIIPVAITQKEVLSLPTATGHGLESGHMSLLTDPQKIIQLLPFIE